jgi:hypothetical protein
MISNLNRAWVGSLHDIGDNVCCVRDDLGTTLIGDILLLLLGLLEDSNTDNKDDEDEGAGGKFDDKDDDCLDDDANVTLDKFDGGDKSGRSSGCADVGGAKADDNVRLVDVSVGAPGKTLVSRGDEDDVVEV